MAPLVVVESPYDPLRTRKVGSIDAGDLVLVNSPRKTDQIVTYGINASNQFSGIRVMACQGTS